MKKKILFIIMFLFFFNDSKAMWIEITKNKNGDTFYAELDQIKKENNFIFFWALIDSSSIALSDRSEIRSIKSYQQCDCNSYKYKTLNWSFHTNNMGEGKSEKESNYDSIQLFSNDYWTYPSDGSSEKKIIEFVCKSFKD